MSIFNSACFLYGTRIKWAGEWVIEPVPALLGAFAYTILLVQTWHFIRLVSLASQRVLPTLWESRGPTSL